MTPKNHQVHLYCQNIKSANVIIALLLSYHMNKAKVVNTTKKTNQIRWLVKPKININSTIEMKNVKFSLEEERKKLYPHYIFFFTY